MVYGARWTNPAYEWGFSDVNPPHPRLGCHMYYQIESTTYGRKDRVFLEKMFQKLVVNFTWWVNRKDENGRNVFEGGFLGLDNIGAFDSRPGPHGGFIWNSLTLQVGWECIA